MFFFQKRFMYHSEKRSYSKASYAEEIVKIFGLEAELQLSV